MGTQIFQMKLIQRVCPLQLTWRQSAEPGGLRQQSSALRLGLLEPLGAFDLPGNLIQMQVLVQQVKPKILNL